jgi:hypothetical protein
MKFSLILTSKQFQDAPASTVNFKLTKTEAYLSVVEAKYKSLCGKGHTLHTIIMDRIPCEK